MATQGLISVVKKGAVIMKVVAGIDGQRIRLVTRELRKKWPMTINEVYELALSKRFGNHETLVVMTESKILHESEIICRGDEETLDLYFKTFNQPNFNPRWESGTADHIEIIDVSA